MKALRKPFSSIFLEYVDALVDLFYPGLCIICDDRTGHNAELFCTSCQYQIVKTNQHLSLQNDFTQHFKGKLNLVTGSSLFYFIKDGILQHALHLMKYGGRADLAYSFGSMFGEQFHHVFPYNTVDMIIPVPLHKKKKVIRGYNQASFFAKGISEKIQKPYYDNILSRVENTSSQTQKNRWQRYENVTTAFESAKNQSLNGKHILLVDDILTTGATLEACALTLQKNYSCQISMATIAMAIKN